MSGRGPKTIVYARLKDGKDIKGERILRYRGCDASTRKAMRAKNYGNKASVPGGMRRALAVSA